MNNQEVMELMNRYLDGDLDERELERLERHLAQSPEAAAMFERLKRLHLQLEQLPAVTPPSSIVDAILPRLEQIGAGEEEAAAKDAPSRRKGRARPKRAWTGAAVAVLVLAVALPSGIGFLNRQAAPDMAESSGAAPASVQSGPETASVTEKQPLVAFSGVVQDQYGGSGSPEAGGTREPGVDAAVRPTAGEGGAERTGAAEGKKFPLPDETKSEGLSFGFTGTSDASAPDASAPGAADPETAAPGNPASGAAPEEAGKREAVTAFAEGNPPAGWQVAVERIDGGVRVVLLDDQGAAAFVSGVYPGEVANFRWSADGSRLSFDHVLGDETERVTVDVRSGTVQPEPGAP